MLIKAFVPKGNVFNVSEIGFIFHCALACLLGKKRKKRKKIALSSKKNKKRRKNKNTLQDVLRITIFTHCGLSYLNIFGHCALHSGNAPFQHIRKYTKNQNLLQKT